MSAPEPPIGIGPWGLPIIPPDPPIADVELGLTTSEDADDWAPPPADMPISRFLLEMFWNSMYAGFGTLRYYTCRTGIHRRRRYL